MKTSYEAGRSVAPWDFFIAITLHYFSGDVTPLFSLGESPLEALSTTYVCIPGFGVGFNSSFAAHKLCNLFGVFTFPHL